jgi:hypothetical protein
MPSNQPMTTLPLVVETMGRSVAHYRNIFTIAGAAETGSIKVRRRMSNCGETGRLSRIADLISDRFRISETVANGEGERRQNGAFLTVAQSTLSGSGLERPGGRPRRPQSGELEGCTRK